MHHLLAGLHEIASEIRRLATRYECLEVLEERALADWEQKECERGKGHNREIYKPLYKIADHRPGDRATSAIEGPSLPMSGE
ncbi:MAG: hypothetical protein NVSMB1_06240 [Polyangiales bacterium]